MGAHEFIIMFTKKEVGEAVKYSPKISDRHVDYWLDQFKQD